MKYKFKFLIILLSTLLLTATPQTVYDALSNLNVSAQPQNGQQATTTAPTTPAPAAATVVAPVATDTQASQPTTESSTPAETSTASTSTTDATTPAVETNGTTAPSSEVAPQNGAANMTDAELDNLVKLLGDNARVTELKNNLELLQKSKAAPTEATAAKALEEITENSVMNIYFGKIKEAFKTLYTTFKALPEAKIQIAPAKQIQISDNPIEYKTMRQWPELGLYLGASILIAVILGVILHRIFSALHTYLLDKGPIKERLPFLVRCFLRIMIAIVPVFINAAVIYAFLKVSIGDDRALFKTVFDFMAPFYNVFLLYQIIGLALATHRPHYRLVPFTTPLSVWTMSKSKKLLACYLPFSVAYQLHSLPRPPSFAFNYWVQFITGVIFLVALVSFILSMHRVTKVFYRIRRHRIVKNPLVWLYDYIIDFWHIPVCLYFIFVGCFWFLDIKSRESWLFSNTIAPLLFFVILLTVINLINYLKKKAISIFSKNQRRHTGSLNALVDYGAVFATIFAIITFMFVIISGLGLKPLGWLQSKQGQGFIHIFVNITVFISLWIFVKEMINTFLERYLSTTNEEGEYINDNARIRTILPLIKNLFLIAMTIGFVLVGLASIGVNITPFLAVGGVAGIAIGFGSQKIVADFITGMFNLIEDTMQVGDVVEVNGFSGTVEHLSIRSLKLRDVAGHVHTIPFSSIDNVSNLTKDYSYAVLEIGIAYRENVDHVMEVLAKLGEEMVEDTPWRYYILEDLEMLGLDSLADSAVVIKCRFKTRAGKKWSVTREFNRRVKNRFDEIGIEIPYPHMTVYFGVDKHGVAPAANIKFQQENLDANIVEEKPKKKPQRSKNNELTAHSGEDNNDFTGSDDGEED
ncbi:MAG: mechanosensitive ion channel family protein [Alphaproteobacteria bacterium]